jgi:hypothetical protein
MKASKKVRIDPGEVRELSEAERALDRAEQLMHKEDVHEALLDIFTRIEQGFDKQADRADDNMDWWDCYNCILGAKQAYNGHAQIFVPIVHSAIEARKTRFVNQIFPKNGRYIEAVSEDGTVPHTETALLEHYVRKAKLRTQIAPALCKNGDIEGQMTIQVSWEEFRRHVVYRVKKPAEMEGLPTGEDVDDIQEEELVEGRPVVKTVADTDLLVLPPTSDSLEEALRNGGSVTTICRWSEAKVKEMVKTEELDPEEGEALLEELKDDSKLQQRQDKQKNMVDAAGIKTGARGKYVLVYRTWVMLTIDGERRLCLAYYGGEQRILSCKRNPYWSDRIDIISAPVDKVDGSFKGRSKLAFGVADLQYHANDVCNQGADSATYALCPITMTDPEKNPGDLTLALGAIWKTSPNDTQFAKFPPLWQDALELVFADQQAIFQALSVNPAQITQSMGSKKKPSQAEIANEQQVDVLTTADAVTVMEDEIYSPLVTFMLELDHQYRDKPLRVRQYGETGLLSNMIAIPLIQMDKMYQFRWFGVEQARNAQSLQQQVAGLNVLRGVPPQLIQGYRLDLGPLLSHMVDNLFGPRLGATILKDQRQEISVEPEMENQLLLDGFVVPVHPMDDLKKHIPAHQQAMQKSGDPHGTIRVHLMAHMNAFQAQQQAQQQAQMGQGPPNGGPPQQGGGSRGPRQGAMPGMPRGGQQPAGAIHKDQMSDPMRMPR